MRQGAGEVDMLTSAPGGEHLDTHSARSSVRKAVLLTFSLVTACNNGSEPSESLNVLIRGSSPIHQNDPQSISVMVTLTVTTQYANSDSTPRPGPLGQRSPASASETTTQVVPDALSLTLDGQLVPCSPAYPSYFWDTSKFSDGTHVFRATARYRSLSASTTWQWVLYPRPATLQLRGSPIR